MTEDEKARWWMRGFWLLVVFGIAGSFLDEKWELETLVVTGVWILLLSITKPKTP